MRTVPHDAVLFSDLMEWRIALQLFHKPFWHASIRVSRAHAIVAHDRGSNACLYAHVHYLRINLPPR